MRRSGEVIGVVSSGVRRDQGLGERVEREFAVLK